MLKIIRQSCRISLLLPLFGFMTESYGSAETPINCLVDGTDDLFQLYQQQISYQSPSFTHYQLINGLTVVIVNRTTLRFNRLTNLNLLPHSTLDPTKPAEPIQMFNGQCHYPRGEAPES